MTLEGVKFRLYVAGAMVDEVAVILGAGSRELIGAMGQIHGAIVEQAAARGDPWLIEIVFPDGDHVRWGTDADGMVEPLPVALAELTVYFAERYGESE